MREARTESDLLTACSEDACGGVVCDLSLMVVCTLAGIVRVSAADRGGSYQETRLGALWDGRNTLAGSQAGSGSQGEERELHVGCARCSSCGGGVTSPVQDRKGWRGLVMVGVGEVNVQTTSTVINSLHAENRGPRGFKPSTQGQSHLQALAGWPPILVALQQSLRVASTQIQDWSRGHAACYWGMAAGAGGCMRILARFRPQTGSRRHVLRIHPPPSTVSTPCYPMLDSPVVRLGGLGINQP